VFYCGRVSIVSHDLASRIAGHCCETTHAHTVHPSCATDGGKDLPSSISPHHAMHNRNILALDVVHHNLADLCIQPSIPQKQQISSLERGLHGSGENDNDWGW
jgi:hypothetical protein